jgi:uncharacterized protein
MDREKNKQIVKETWDAFWRGDIEAGVANMSDDITWLAPGSNKMSGLKVGKDAIRRFRFTELGVFRDLKRTVVGLYADGDTVILEVKADGHLRNGEPYENAGCVIWQLRGGKIAHVRQYVDTQKAMAINALFKEGADSATGRRTMAITKQGQLSIDFLDAMGTRNTDALTRLLAEEAVWHTPPSTMPPYQGEHHGRPAVISFLVGAGGALFEKGTLRIEIIKLITEGDEVAIQCFMKARALAGFDYANQYAFFFRYSGDRIMEIWENADTAYVYGVFGIDAKWVRRDIAK